MKPKIRLLVIGVVLAFIAAALVWNYTFKKADTNVSARKADFELKASELIAAFDSNEAAANTQYLNKVISVNGMVESISEDSLGISVYLKEPDAIGGVICGFDLKSNDVSLIRKGSSITIKGICTGYLLDVVMNKCSVEK
ncbi:MAG TPA: hypothetical protein VK179_08665 [Bacteroidales bacterium]|nr:hypothetical protein [Bacteroidales bacterium]